MPVRLGRADWKEMENARNADLAERLHQLGLPTARFERIFRVRRGARRKPDVTVVNGEVHIVSGKFGNSNELKSVTTAQEYKEDLTRTVERAGKRVGEVFGVTYPASKNEKFILHVLPREGRREISARFDTLEELAARLADTIRGLLTELQKVEEPVQDEASRLFRWGAEDLAGTLKVAHLAGLEELFGGHDFFRSLLLPRLKGDARKDALRLGAAYLFVNQVLFYVLLSEAAQRAGRPYSDEYPLIRLEHFDSPKLLREEYFERVHSQNYEPIYGFNVAQFFQDRPAREASKDLVRGILGLAPKLDVPDLVGQVFQTLIPFEIRKPLGAHYTNPKAAALLARLAVRSSNAKVLDPACGSGTLLVAAYRRKRALAPRGDSADLHHRFVEEDITGIDAMGFSAHLAAVNLALQHPLVETEHVRIGLADSTTKRPPDPAKRRDIGDAETVISPTEVIAAHEFRQSDLRQSFDTPRVPRRATKVVKMSRKEAQPIQLEPVDLVIMNPPFTSWDNMGEAYRENVKRSFVNEVHQRDVPSGGGEVVHEREFTEAVHWKTSQQTFFLLLADLFLKPGGRVAAVLPVTTLTGQAFAPLVKYLLANYTIETVVVGLGRTSFSEDTSLSECLFVARKERPKSRATFRFVGTERPPNSWTPREIDQAATAIHDGVSVPGLVRVSSPATDSLRPENETLSGLMFRLYGDYARAQKRLSKLYEESPVSLVPFERLGPTMKRWVLGGGWLKYFGSKGLFVYRSSDRATKDSDRLVVTAEEDGTLRVKDRANVDRTGTQEFVVSKSVLTPALRSFAYVPSFDVSHRADYVVARPTSAMRELLITEYNPKAGAEYFARAKRDVKKKSGGRWKNLIADGYCNLAFSGRLNLAAVGTRALCVRNDERMLLAAYGFTINGLPDARTEKLLCLWFNSTPFLLSLMDKLTITEGTWVRMEQFVLFPSRVPNPDDLSPKQWADVEKLYDDLREQPLPSLLEQLGEHPSRVALDDGILRLLGVDDKDEREQLGTMIRKGVRTALVGLRGAMGEGKKTPEEADDEE